jgi:predicted RNA binding protein YcfA (HicA-like mRNA interferase family)
MKGVGKISWQRFEKFLTAMGCEFKGQEGSHRKYKKEGIQRPIIVPARKELPDLVIQTNLRTLGISRDFFIKKIQNFR